MIGLIIIIATFLVLFLMAFFTRRRFGLLGLGLAAGVLLNQLISPMLVGPVEGLHINFAPLTASGVLTIVMTILPSFLLLLTGPKQHGKIRRLITSLVYAVIATALIIIPITTAWPVADPMARNVLTLFTDIQLPILAFGIILALVDVLFTRREKRA
jgi:hypothetical protein